jgi:hypothetical protein
VKGNQADEEEVRNIMKIYRVVALLEQKDLGGRRLSEYIE